MSLSVDWPTGVIAVPKADTVLVGTDPISGRQIRTYNSDTFRRELRDLEDDEAGRAFSRTHDFNAEVTLGGATYAAQLIVNSAYYTVEFEDGTYRVSIEGTNNNIADVSVINSVSIQPNNSAGLVVVDSGAGSTDRVYVDPDQVLNGDGSAGDPFNNIGDAIDFAEANKLKILVAYSEITLDRNLKNFTVIGLGVPVINTAGYDLKGSKFFQCTMRGTYLDRIIVQESVLDDAFELNGFFEKCALNGDVVCIDGGAVLLAGCFSNLTGLVHPSLSLNGIGSSTVTVSDYVGGLIIKDVNNAADAVTIGIKQGDLTLENSCTDGNIIVRGETIFTDNSDGSTVNTDGLCNKLVWSAKKVDNNDTDSMGESVQNTEINVSTLL